MTEKVIVSKKQNLQSATARSENDRRRRH